MKKLVAFVICFLGLLALSSCSVKAEGETTTTPTTPTTPTTYSCDPNIEEKNLAAMKAYLGALTSGQPFDRSLYWTPDATLVIPEALPYGGTYTFDKFQEYEAALFGNWDIQIDSPPTLYAACDKVFLSSVWKATAKATRVQVNEPILEVFTFNPDAKMTGDTFYFLNVQNVVNALQPPQ
ncbi:MAG: hypothetical protein ACRCYY_16980 [Trueperaceae bacterium]